MIEEFGWRVAYLGLAALPLLFAGPLVFFFQPDERLSAATDDEQLETGLTLGQAMREYRFWVLLVSIFMVYIAMSGMVQILFRR